MNNDNNNAEMNKYLFINLVTMLGMSAMQQLGKIIHPAAGKAEINLEAAQATIDTLDMLAAKTSGNLDKDEARLMQDTLAALKMNFVETRDEEERKEKSEVRDQGAAVGSQSVMPDAKAQNAGGEQPGPGPQDKSGVKQKKEEPKFHKSYQ